MLDSPTIHSTSPVGGQFVLESPAPEQILAPEELPGDARMMARSVEEFVRKDVLPVDQRIEAQEPGLMRSLVQKAGGIGLLGAGLPEIYGGLGLPFSHVALLIEKAALNGSFSVSIGAHTIIGSLPLLYFGTLEQKQQYLPRLASGEMVGAFALSEANCGSDALSSQTRATLDGDHYLLNGTKMWTTNAGFADLFTIFAKVDGEHLTAFLVEKGTPGLSLGREEHKLGIKGSSTCRVILENARVPAGNIVGELGKGYRVALYVLNIGRFNLGVGALGSSKEVLGTAARYAKQRVQFGRPIASFGLIQAKLGEMAARLYALESMAYRTAGNFESRFSAVDHGAEDANEQLRAAAEEYAIESAIMKFYGSEVLDFVVDEGLQIHGGFGYTEEFPMAKVYRDARINRIFEGTNEINRLTVMDQLIRRSMKGRLALPQAAARVKDAVLSMSPPAGSDDEVGACVEQIRNVLLFVAGQAWESLGDALAEQQEIIAALADITAALLALESAWLRARKSNDALAKIAVQLLAAESANAVTRWAGYALAGFRSGDDLRAQLATVRRLLKAPLVNEIALKRELAAAVLERERYPW